MSSAIATSSVTAYGVDACKAGWFCIALEPSGEINWCIFPKLVELVALADESARIFVDIPIGLPEGPKKRCCDKEARRKLRFPRSASVFRTPVRAALEAESYEEAKCISRKKTGKALSRQTYAILGKIKEVDDLLRICTKAKCMVYEVHPEICFWALAGEKLMRHSKKKCEGHRERIKVLECYCPSFGSKMQQILDSTRRSDLARDDILDAMSAAITASADVSALQTLTQEPPCDIHGLPMRMVYVPKKAFAK